MLTSVKLVDPEKGLIEGLAIPFGGPLSGKDLDGEFFTKSTNFLLDDYDKRPLRYQHAKDPAIGWDRIGWQTKAEIKDDEGMWVSAQLDLAHDYAARVIRLLRGCTCSDDPCACEGKSVLGFSSGAQGSGVLMDYGSGEILRWPWVELSLTPTPANPYAMVEGKSIRLAAPAATDPSADDCYCAGMRDFESIRLAAVGLDLQAHELGVPR